MTRYRDDPFAQGPLMSRGNRAVPKPDEVSIGKFDVLATYTFARALADGYSEGDAKQRGMVAAIMGAQARLGIRKDHHEEFTSLKEAAEKKKKTTITAESFDRQVASKMGAFFGSTFLPAMRKFVDAQLSYDDVKRAIRISATWGAKISGEQFAARTSEFFNKANR
jgi:hypothetical protein